MADAIDRDAGLGDIGGDDDFSKFVRSEGAVLFLGLESAVEGNAGDLLIGAEIVEGIEGAVDLTAAGHEDEDVAGAVFIDNALDGLGRLRGDLVLIRDGKVVDLDGEALSLGNEDGALVEILSDWLGIESGGHDEHREIGALGLLEIFDKGEGDIAEEIALVEFIEEHGTDFRECAVVLEPAEEDALGDKDDAGVGAGLVVKADLITDFSAEFSFSL